MSRAPAAATTLAGLLDALAQDSVRVVDLSHDLSERTPMIELPAPLANAPGFELHTIARYDERGPMFAWNSFTGSEHMGTHFDAPVHWITGRDGKDVGQIAGSELVGPAVVIDRTAEVERDPEYLLTVDDVRGFEEEHGPVPDSGWLLFRTGWERRHDDPKAFVASDDTGSHWPGMDPACAEHLAQRPGLRGFGTEQVGIDAGRAYEFDPPYPAHHHLLGAGKYGLASLANLGELPPTGAVLVVAPLRIEGGTGSPSRIYALVPTI